MKVLPLLKCLAWLGFGGLALWATREELTAQTTVGDGVFYVKKFTAVASPTASPTATTPVFSGTLGSDGGVGIKGDGPFP